MNAVRRQSRAPRTLQRRIFTALAVLLCAPAVLRGDDPVAVREIKVPAGQPELWPAGDWRPLSSNDYRRLLRLLGEPGAGPRRVWTERAEYAATLMGDTLGEGSLTLQVRRQESEATFLQTGPTSLAISDLKWSDGESETRDAVWGRGPAGETAIYLDRDDGTLRGNWTLRGERLGRAVHFDLHIPQANASSLRLRLPADASLQSSCGVVSGSLEVDGHGLREWLVDLGSRRQCRLTVVAGSAAEMRPVVLSEVETAATAREDGLHFQAKVTLEALHAPIRAVTLLLPHDLDVYSVTYGELPLTWQRAAVKGQTRLQVELPDPLVGTGRSLRVYAIAQIRTGRDLEVPRLVVEEAFFGRSQVHLEIERPLELQDLELHGSRQIATIARGAQGASYTFEEYHPDARIVVRLGRPRLNLTAQVLTHLSAAPQDWALRSEIRWKCLSGSTFSTTIAIPPGWDVTEVRPSGSTAGGNQLNWDLRRARGQSLVVLDFAESFDSGELKAVEILARRRVEPGIARETALLLPQPGRAQISEMLVGVTYPAAESLEVHRAEPFEQIEMGRVPAELAQSPVWSAFEAAQARSRSVMLRAASPPPGARITVERQSPAFRARADVIAEFDGEQVIEQFAIEIASEREPVANVRVYWSTPGPEPVWRIAGEEENLLAARRLAPHEHSRWGVPPDGELWEITPATPLHGRFTIGGTRTRRIQPGDGVLLAFVPEGADFEGTVELKAIQGRLPEMEARGPHRVEDGETASGTSASVQRWRYRAASDALQIASLPGSGSGRTDRTARLHLTSRFSAAGGSDLRHRARFQIGHLLVPGRFRFELPAPCTLLRAIVDGNPVSITRQGPEYLLPTMPAGRPHHVEIDYRSPAVNGSLSAEQTIPVPTTPFEVLHFDWDCVLPDGMELTVAPSAVRLHSRAAVASWLERFFGPLGRPQGTQAFNPFSGHAWAELFLGPTGRERADGGGTAYRASAPTSPELLVFETWDRSRGRTAAWGVFLATLFIGVTLRLFRLSGRVWIASIWLATGLAAAWILPAGWAEIAGAAVAGALLTILVPGRLIRPLPPTDRDSPSIGSTETVSYGRAAAGSALVAIVLLRAAGAASGQEASPVAGRDSAEFSVLVPVESEAENQAEPVVFVSRELWERSLIIGEEDRPGWLISSARYEAEIDAPESAKIRATYRVALIGATEPLQILLPITGGHLAGPEACRVNGTVHPVLPSAAGSGFVIAPNLDQLKETDDSPAAAAEAPVDAVIDGHWTGLAEPARWLDIELDIRVPIAASPTGGRFAIGIPDVPSARASVSFRRAQAAVEIVGAHGKKATSGDGRRVQAELGSISRLQIVWSSEDQVDYVGETETSIATLIDAQPTRLQMRSRVAYQVKRGTVQSLVWEVPREMVPRKITLGPAEPITGWFVSPAGESSLHLHIPLPAPKSQDFVVEATFTLPVRPQGEEIVVPAFDLLAPHPNRERMAYRHQIGVGSKALYRVEAPAAPADALGALTTESFLAEFARDGSSAGIERPRVAWRLQRPSELRFRLIRVAPERRAWPSQTGHIGLSEVDWTAAIELETNAVPAFHHRLSVNPLLEIDSISVHEDEVDRLARWSRDGESVVLHLNDRTTGVQNIVVKGRMPLDPSGATPLPVIGIEDAEFVDSRLYLYHAPGVDVDLSGELETLPGPFRASGESGASLALGQYRLPPGEAVPSVTVHHAEAVSRFDSLITARPGSDGSLEVRVLIRPVQRAGEPRPVHVAIPPRLADLKPVHARGASYRLSAGADGTSTLIITPEPGVTADPEVALTGSVAASPDGEWVVPIPSSSDAEQGEAFLVVSAAEPLELAGSIGSAVEPGDVPGWVAQSEAFRAFGSPTRVYQASAAEWRMRRSAPTRSTGPLIALFDTELWARSGGEVFGRMQLVLPPLDEPVSVLLQWPKGIRLRSLAIEGKQPRSVEPHSGVLAVPLQAAPTPQVVTVDWIGPLEAGWWPLTWTSLRMPVPQDAEVGVGLITVRAQGRPWLARQTSLSTQTGHQNHRDRIEALLAACRDADPELLAGTAAYAELSRLERLLSENRASAGTRPVREATRLRERVADASDANRRSQSGLADSAVDEAHDPTHLFAGRPGRLEAELTWWAVDRTVVNWGLLLLGMAVALPIALWFIRSRPSRWLQSRPSFALVVLGVVWWACLRPSFVGLAILVAAAVLSWRGRTQQQREEPPALQFE